MVVICVREQCPYNKDEECDYECLREHEHADLSNKEDCTSISCPHCNCTNVISKEQQNELKEYGKAVVNCDNCDRLYTLRIDDDGRVYEG